MNSIKPICLSAFAIWFYGCGAQKQVSSFSQAVAISAFKY
jgi:hypothetical protein